MDFSWLQIIVAAIAGVIGTGGIAAIISAVASYLSKRREIAAQSITESQRLALDRDKHTDDVLMKLNERQTLEIQRLEAKVAVLVTDIEILEHKEKRVYNAVLSLKREFSKLIIAHCPDEIIEVLNAKRDQALRSADDVLDILSQ